MNNPDKFLFNNELIKALRNARWITILTGAGISAESGIPTFRDAQRGLWANYSPEELASPEGFARNPELVWNWYEWRRKIISESRPNPGHYALARMEKIIPQVNIITQNVDGLHQLAGSLDVVELHGNIHRNRCSSENTLVDEILNGESKPPRCPRCKAFIRPDVVWFGESLPAASIERAIETSSKCDVFFSIGTSSVVYPAASLPFVARNQGAIIVEINPASTPLSPYSTYTLHGSAGFILPALMKVAWQEEESH